MLTREQVLEAIRGGRESQCLDMRDYNRLSSYFPVKDWAVFSIKPSEAFDPAKFEVKDWTRANILSNLASDVDFGFEKALDKRGISANFMFFCVKQWLWILEDPLCDQADELYTHYALPLFKAVALKYDLPNKIGDDAGNEHKYSAEADV